MAKASGKMVDKYANIGAIACTQAAANDMVFQELQTYISIFDKKALVIGKIIYEPAFAAWAELDAETDSMSFGIATSNLAADGGPATVYNRPDIVDFNHINTLVAGTPASIERRLVQIEKDFSTLSGGGLLVPARPIYGWFDTGGFAAATVCYMRIYFNVIDISVDEYWELVEATRIVS